MKLSWNWLKEYVSPKQSIETVCERLTMTGLEVKRIEKTGDDFLIETEVTSNRPDWLSHIGVAREIAAIFNLKLKLPPSALKTISKTNRNLKVKTLNTKLAPYYSAVILENISWKESPDWMKDRLQVCGIRPINFLVDVTNYVLLEYGQPLHAFDLDKLSGDLIVAREGKPNEKVRAINDVDFTLTNQDVVIADEKGVIAIGGVMGGKETEVSSSTKNILLESAFFSPSPVRQTARRLKLGSESSYRFERGVDPLGVNAARNRAIYLISEHASVGTLGKPLTSGSLPQKAKKITLRSDQVNQVLGTTNITANMSKSFLSRLGVKTQTNGKSIVSVPPSFREDLIQGEDLIEEIARLYGYDTIPETIPIMKPNADLFDSLYLTTNTVQDLCVSSGLQEVVTFSMIDPVELSRFNSSKDQLVTFDNPRNQHLTLLRPTLLLNFLEVIKRNLNMGRKSVAIFEIGNRYFDLGKELPKEDKTLAIALSGERPWNWSDSKREFQVYDLKGIFQELTSQFVRSAKRIEIASGKQTYYDHTQVFDLKVDGATIGYFGKVESSILNQAKIEKPIYFGEISLSELTNFKKIPVVSETISNFPSTERDLSVIVKESVKAEEMIKIIHSLGEGLVQSVQVFDLYRGGKIPNDKKSISLRICYQSNARTLQANEVNDLHFRIISELSRQYGAELPHKGSE